MAPMSNNQIVSDHEELCLIFQLCADLLSSGLRLSISFAALPPDSDLSIEEEELILDAFHNNAPPPSPISTELEDWAREVRESSTD